MLRKCKIYLNIEPAQTDSSLIIELLRYGIDGFVVNFDKYEPADFSAFIKLIRNLSAETHFFPEIFVYLSKYECKLLPVFKACQLSSLILSADFNDEQFEELRRDLMTANLSHVKIHSMLNTEQAFTEIMKLSKIYRGFVLDRSTNELEKSANKNIKCIELLHELHFAKIPGMILCPVSFDDKSSISELSDLFHCVKDGASSILMDHRGIITEEKMPYVKAYCDMIYEGIRPRGEFDL